MNEKQRLIKELQKRLPHSTLSLKKLSIRKFLLGMLLMCSLLYSLFFLITAYTLPQIYIPVHPTEKWQQSFPASVTTQVYQHHNMRFLIPTSFKLTRTNQQGLIFNHPTKKQTLSISPGLFQALPNPVRFFLRSLLGVSSGYQFYRLIYESPFGILPLVLKGMITTHLSNVQVYKVETIHLQALLIEAFKEKKYFTEVVVFDKQSGQELSLILSAQHPLDKKVLKSIMTSVRSMSSSPHEHS
jgi:hypothetical protein